MSKLKKILKVLGWILAFCTAVGIIIDLIDHAKNKVHGHAQGFYERWIKRPIDFFSSLTALVVLSPVFCLLGVLVKNNLGSPVMFSQTRIGQGERPFKLRKFRSMTDERDADGNLLPDEQRLPKFGRLLRSSSLDELPELISILTGDMSIVGPRPLPIDYLDYFYPEEHIIHEVKGGLVPPDVLTGHSVYDWNEQFKNEMNYVNHISFKTDLKIIICTFKILFKRNKNDYGGTIRKSLIEERKGQL